LTSTDAQVRKLMTEIQKTNRVAVSGLRAGMDRKTARKYLSLKKLPSELRKPRTWRTRADPFEAVWEELVQRLVDAPELEAKTLFEDLLERFPGKFQPGQLRTLQRRIRQWRATKGPEKRVFFSQQHRPGEAAQTDFTDMNSLNITIEGEAFDHLVSHFVLPYSNWECVKPCLSESMPALKAGIQKAVFMLGRAPMFHQTDHSTAATHRLGKQDRESANACEASDTPSPKGDKTRGFNADYLALMDHLGMIPRTTAVGEKEQNGDVESLNGAFKRRVKQWLLMRGSRDFPSVPEYEAWLDSVVAKANAHRTVKVSEELDRMKAVRVERLVEFKELDVMVTSWSTVRVKRNTYSVPSRLIGRRVRVRVYEGRIEIRLGDDLQLGFERLLGEGGSRINYRHVIHSLVRKPGAFERYRYREALFPTLSFRRCFDALLGGLPDHKAVREYLRILKLAADTVESHVEVALDELMAAGEPPLVDAIKAKVAPEKTTVPELESLEVELEQYDSLFESQAVELMEVPS